MSNFSMLRAVAAAAVLAAIIVVVYVLMASGDAQGHCLIDLWFGSCRL